MFNKSYQAALEYVATLAPSLDGATKYFAWVEDIVSTLAFIYSEDPDDVMQELTDAVKEHQDWDDE